MMQWRRIGCASVLWAITSGLACAGEAAAFSVTYDQKVTARGQVQTAKVMLKDERFRIDTTVEGTTSVAIRNADGLYLYLPQERMAMQMPALDPAQQMVEQPENYLGYLKERNARLIGTDIVNGQPCDVYEFTDPSTGARTKAWVWQEKRFPVKIETDSPQGRMTVELTNIVLGAAIPDSMFELPPGVTMMPMGQMMQGLEALPDLKSLLGDQR